MLFGWKASENGTFDTQAADIRRTFRLSELRRTNVIEVNHWAKVANKQQILMYKTAVYTLVNGALHIKNRKYQKGDIAQQYIDT